MRCSRYAVVSSYQKWSKVGQYMRTGDTVMGTQGLMMCGEAKGEKSHAGCDGRVSEPNASQFAVYGAVSLQNSSHLADSFMYNNLWHYLNAGAFRSLTLVFRTVPPHRQNKYPVESAPNSGRNTAATFVHSSHSYKYETSENN